MYGCADI